jgi:hypothetical protein
MTTSLSPTLAVPAPPATVTAGVPCAARPGTSFQHLDGQCQCFFGGAAPVLAAPPYPHPHPATSSRGVTTRGGAPGRRRRA